MVDGAHLRVGVRELVGDLGGAVRAAIVDDDDFEVRGQL
jgi:hypothetical protein